MVDCTFILDGTAEYLNERRRKRSEEQIIFSNLYNQARLDSGEYKDPIIEKLTKAPQNIAKNQKKLNSGYLKLQSCPLYPDKLKLQIPKVKFDKKSEYSDPIKTFELRNLLQPGPMQDKWDTWNKQLQMSIDYWHKRFPYAETAHVMAQAKV